MYRRQPLVSGYIYHVMNRGVEKRTIFQNSADFSRFITSLSYYRFSTPPVKLSVYLESPDNIRKEYNQKLKQVERNVTILAYCLMNNHFHLLLKQEIDEGITKYVQKISDSYTKYFNKRYERVGALFQGSFKSVLIEHNEELLHVSRYIHLNPHTANKSMNMVDCFSYPWSSIKYYSSPKPSFIDPAIILSSFKTGFEGYKTFIEEQGGHQRTLLALKTEHTEINL